MKSSESADRANRRGNLFVISGPSGVGKTTIARRIASLHPDIFLSVSATTRAPRPEEKNGVNYQFVTPAEFDAMEQRGAFLETATVFGMNRYGTPLEPVERALDRGRHVLLEIDVQGAHTVKARLAETITIFMEPPSWEVLESRLFHRGTEAPEALARRLETAREELKAASEFDYRVVNDTVDDAVAEVERILGEDPSPKGT